MVCPAEELEKGNQEVEKTVKKEAENEENVNVVSEDQVQQKSAAQRNARVGLADITVPIGSDLVEKKSSENTVPKVQRPKMKERWIIAKKKS